MKKIENSIVIENFYGESIRELICPYHHYKHNIERFLTMSLAIKEPTSSSYYSHNYDSVELTDLISAYLKPEII